MIMYIIIAIGILAAAVLAYNKRKKKPTASADEPDTRHYLERLKGHVAKYLWTNESMAKKTRLGPGSGRPMNILSHKTSAQYVDEYIGKWKRTGCNAWYAYLACHNDAHRDTYTKPDHLLTDDGRWEVNPFDREIGHPEWGLRLHAPRVAMMRQRIQHIKGSVPLFVAWLFSDQSSKGFKLLPLARRREAVRLMVEAFDDLVDCYVLGLEAHEEWKLHDHQNVAAYLRTLTSKPIGFHLGPDMPVSVEKAWGKGCDIYFAQFKTGQTPQSIKPLVAAKVKSHAPMPVVASELERMGGDPNAMAVANAARSVAGCWGSGT